MRSFHPLISWDTRADLRVPVCLMQLTICSFLNLNRSWLGASTLFIPLWQCHCHYHHGPPDGSTIVVKIDMSVVIFFIFSHHHCYHYHCLYYKRESSVLLTIVVNCYCCIRLKPISCNTYLLYTFSPYILMTQPLWPGVCLSVSVSTTDAIITYYSGTVPCIIIVKCAIH